MPGMELLNPLRTVFMTLTYMCRKCWEVGKREVWGMFIITPWETVWDWCFVNKENMTYHCLLCKELRDSKILWKLCNLNQEENIYTTFHNVFWLCLTNTKAMSTQRIFFTSVQFSTVWQLRLGHPSSALWDPNLRVL